VPIDAKLVARLHRRADAGRWGVSLERFAEALERSAARGADVNSLHLEDLALACGCAAGNEAAWEHFVREHRPVLYRAADALDPGGGARDLADGIYGELFERSLFQYFHGRSSLSTWLRAVLAQRHVDRFRATRRLAPLPDSDASALAASERSESRGLTSPADIAVSTLDRPRYAGLMRDALQRTLTHLEVRDRLRLACYYAQGLTLAETGTLLGEHEATCSRHLARTRKQLRNDIERDLRTFGGLSEAEIADCVAAISEDAGPLDLRELLAPVESVELRKKVPAERSTLRGTT
jgi:RNA polymerase sigma factor (sigma-70 family)